MPTFTSANDLGSFMLEAHAQATQLGKLAQGPYLVAIDGRSGSGKTTLARQIQDILATAGTTVELFHLEDLYQGWDGLAQAVQTWQELALSLTGDGTDPGPTPLWYGWDWQSGQATGPHIFTPAQAPAGSIVLAEGVGALCGTHDLGVLIELDTLTRKDRALIRDGDTYRPYWDRWALQEEALYSHYRHIYHAVQVTYRPTEGPHTVEYAWPETTR
ncbi:hypothetical protein ACN082_06110 [Rothia sp. CCM 9417]|uniref:hypothetical protein n=1 Tax=Rothia sp. CCM 9417 TaxID=3402657 RepID=UPI003ADF827A